MITKAYLSKNYNLAVYFSDYSLQLRHKETFLPLFIIIAALGIQDLRPYRVAFLSFVGVIYISLSLIF